MVFDLADWRIRVDVEQTRKHTAKNSIDHCECAYCKNYYDTLRRTYPELTVALTRFGIDLGGPSELMPFTSMLYLACYRIQGEILCWGKSELVVEGVPIVLEAADEGSFLLWVGEMELPWIQPVAVEDVMSPANLPEFLERMQDVWQLRHGQALLTS